MPPAPTLRPESWTHLALPPDLAQVSPAVDMLCEALRAGGAEATAVDAVRLGVAEALANAVRHGQAQPGRSEVQLRWSWTDPWLAVEVSEPGEFSPPADWAELPADPLQESGRGGFLISQQFDEVAHANRAGRHALRLRRRLGAPRAAATPAAELEHTLAGMTEELSASYETLAALFKLAEALATAGDLPGFVSEALALRTLVEADAMHVRVADQFGNLPLTASAGGTGEPRPTLRASAAAVENEVFRTGQERTLEAATPRGADDPLRDLRGVAFVCPIHFQGRRQGVCVLIRDRPGAHFSAAQLALARTTAEFIGIACANAELQAQRLAQQRAQRELEIAAQIQQSLVLTDFPQRGDWQVYGMCLNALEAGGDFFDVLEVPGGLLLVIADVMGKGVPAALLAVVLRTAVRANAAHAAVPGELLSRVAQQIAPDLDRLGMFITAQVVFATAATRDIAYANAGHGALLALGASPATDRLLEEGGLPLGVSTTEHYATHNVRLVAGERLLLLTDGVLEAPDSAGRELGMAGVRELAPRGPVAALGIACAELLVKLKHRDGGRPQVDDRTVLLLEPSA